MRLSRIATALSSRFAARAGRPSQASLPEAARVAVESLEHRTLMTVVLPGGNVPLPGASLATQPVLAGVTLRDVAIPFSVSNPGGQVVFRGTLQDKVVREAATGTLDFYQTVRANVGFNLPAFLENAGRRFFNGYTTDANFRTDAGGTPTIKPERAQRSIDGSLVQFAFNHDLVNPGNSSLSYLVKTNATQFAVAGATTLSFRPFAAAIAGGSVTLNTARPIGLPSQRAGSVSGIKFNDLNGDGVRQAGEPGLAGVRIYVDANNNGVFNVGERTALTNAAGQYVIGGLPAGLQHVREVVPLGFRQTAPATGVYNLVLAPGGTAGGLNFGNTRTVRISGTVYSDVNSNGVRNVGEGGLSGFRVYVDANNNGVFNAGERNVLSNAAGQYVLNGLPSGLNRVRVQPKLFYTQTAPAGGAHTLILPSGAVAANRDFGLKFNPIIINPLPLPLPKPIPIPIPLPDPRPLPLPLPIPLPQPIPIPLPRPGPDPSPLI
jgi:hypothetical protein